MRFGIVQFPGSCDEVDALLACRRFGDAELLWHRDAELGAVDAVVIPGGFSYGDYLRAGAIARFSRIMKAVESFARHGGPVLGICNGFQVLCEAHLLPGALLPNTRLRFLCRQVSVIVERAVSPFTQGCDPGQVLSLPVKHGAGRFYASEDALAALDANGQIVMRYAAGHNPNGSVEDIAAVTNEPGNVMGLMPHPEHATHPLSGSTDGGRLFASLAAAAEEGSFAAA